MKRLNTFLLILIIICIIVSFYMYNLSLAKENYFNSKRNNNSKNKQVNPCTDF